MPELAQLNLLGDSSLRSYYQLNTGALTTDYKGVNTLTNNNTVGEIAGKFGIAADFGTSNSDKSLTSVSAFFTSPVIANLTVSLWLKLRTEISSGIYNLFTLCTGANTSSYMDGLLFYDYNGGTRRLTALNRLSSSHAQANYDIALGTSDWYNLVWVKTATTTVTLYINGVQQATDTGTGTDRGLDGQTYIVSLGTDSDASSFASVALDDTAFFERALTENEIQSIYFGQAGLLGGEI